MNSKPLVVKGRQIVHSKCGEVRYEDMRGRASRAYRYEAFCSRCKACDPNGYGSIREMKKEAVGFWAPDRPRLA